MDLNEKPIPNFRFMVTFSKHLMRLDLLWLLRCSGIAGNRYYPAN